jgi:hypothetical protein
MEHLQIPIENRRKRLKRYPITQINIQYHDTILHGNMILYLYNRMKQCQF